MQYALYLELYFDKTLSKLDLWFQRIAIFMLLKIIKHKQRKLNTIICYIQKSIFRLILLDHITYVTNHIKTNQLSSATCFSFQNLAFEVMELLLFASVKTHSKPQQSTQTIIFLFLFGLKLVRNNQRIYIKIVNCEKRKKHM